MSFAIHFIIIFLYWGGGGVDALNLVLNVRALKRCGGGVGGREK